MSARISGQREHRGEIFAKAEWPAIITPAETQRIRAKLGDPGRRTNRSARRYLESNDEDLHVGCARVREQALG